MGLFPLGKGLSGKGMRIKMKKKEIIFSIIIIIDIMLLIFFLTGFKNEMTFFEGGHIALQYDRNNWKLTYQKEEPYSIFFMEEDENYIFILPMESENSILDKVHEELMVDIYGWSSKLINVSFEERIDRYEEQNYAYYIYDFEFTYGRERWIIFEKRLETISAIGIAWISRAENEQEKKAVQEKTDEVLAILSSVSYSEYGTVRWIHERKDISNFYDMLIWISRCECVKEEIDRTRDYVVDEENAKEIAEAALEETIPGWKDRGEYEVHIVYIDQIYKWVVLYLPKKMILDCGAQIRIRRDNGEITYFYESLL